MSQEIKKMILGGKTYYFRDEVARNLLKDVVKYKGVVHAWPTSNSTYSPVTTVSPVGFAWESGVDLPSDGDAYVIPGHGTTTSSGNYEYGLYQSDKTTSMLENSTTVNGGDIVKYSAEDSVFATATPAFDMDSTTDQTGYTYKLADTLTAYQANQLFGINQALDANDLLYWNGSSWELFVEAFKLTVDDTLDESSENVVTNKAIATEIAKMYKYNYSASVSPSIVETGTSNTFTITYTANSQAYGGSTTKYTVSTATITADDSTSSSLDSSEGTNNGYSTRSLIRIPKTNGTHTLYSAVKFSNGVEKSFSTSYNSQYYMYFGSSSAIPTGTNWDEYSSWKRGLANSPATSKTTVNVTAGQYLWLCVPSNMSINQVKDFNTNMEIDWYSYSNPDTITKTINGASVVYKCYRSLLTMNATETLTLIIS